jgi:hypothetical protein
MALLDRLPTELLQKIASGEVTLPKMAGEDGCWLDKFQGTPLLDKAIAIEKEDLEIQMDDNARRHEEAALREQFGGWDETQARRDDLSIKRKLLELELAGGGTGAELGGQEGEDAIPPGAAEEAPPDLEAAEAAAMPPTPKAGPAVAGGAPPPTAIPAAALPAEEGSEEEAAEPHEEAPKGPPAAAKAEGEGDDSGEEAKPKPKPPTTKVTKETTEKPAEEKIDIKAAAARMRFALAAHAIKEAQPADRARPFRRV